MGKVKEEEREGRIDEGKGTDKRGQEVIRT